MTKAIAIKSGLQIGVFSFLLRNRPTAYIKMLSATPNMLFETMVSIILPIVPAPYLVHEFDGAGHGVSGCREGEEGSDQADEQQRQDISFQRRVLFNDADAGRNKEKGHIF